MWQNGGGVCVSKREDLPWAQKSQTIHDPCFRFDPTEVFDELTKTHTLSHAFLVLEADDNILRAPAPVKNAAEMMAKYYSK